MNPAHLHLVFTHLPVVGLGFTLVVNLYALLTKCQHTARLTLILYVLSGFFAAVAFATGDGAEKAIESFPGISEQIIEPHENMAIFLFIGLMLMAGMALLGLFVIKGNQQLLRRFIICLFLAGMLISVFAVKTALTGGAIRHTEILEGSHSRQK